MPKLETVHIEFSDVSAARSPPSRRVPRLKSLDLTEAELDGEELADLAPLKSLEEMSIAASFLSKQSLESLSTLKWLKSLSIYRDFPFEESDRTTLLALDDGEQLEVPEGEAHVFRRAVGNAATIKSWNRH